MCESSTTISTTAVQSAARLRVVWSAQLMVPVSILSLPTFSMSIFSRLVVTTFFTSRQLSRRTVSIP